MSMALDGGPGPLGRAMAQMKEAMGTNDAAELPEPSKNVDIAIVGGGLGGLALAVGLAERGIQAHVFEAAPFLRTDSGTIVGTNNNGHKALEGIKPGLGDAVRATGCPLPTLRMVSKYIGMPWLNREVHPVPPNNLSVVPWRGAQEVLARFADPTAIHCCHKLIAYLPADEAVLAVFRVGSSGAPVVVRARLLVGADGINSRVRATLVGDTPRYLHCIDWNALIPNPGRKVFSGHKPNELVFHENKEAGISWILADAGHGESFWLLRVFDTDRSIMESLGNVAGGFGKEGCKARALAMLAQRLKGSRGSMAREREGTLSEGQTASSGKDSAVSLTPEGWSGPEQEGEDIMEAILGTSKDSIYERFLHDRLPLPSWIGASGRVVLLGDAAHAIYPGPAQGAQMTWEDAHQLCEILKEMPWGRQQPRTKELFEALSRFQVERVKRCTRVQELAAEGSGLPPEVTQGPNVSQLSSEERSKRYMEFTKWIAQYPNNQGGDPKSVYWK